LVLIIRRFDREGGKHIPFLSTMSMLSTRADEQHGYLEMAYGLGQKGAFQEEDMKEL
jgi:hypothetical protein